jgi:hypothetical protein
MTIWPNFIQIFKIYSSIQKKKGYFNFINNLIIISSKIITNKFAQYNRLNLQTKFKQICILK